MSGIHSTSEYTKAALLLLILVGCFIVVSYSFPYWTTDAHGYAGLWTACRDGLCYERYNLWVSEWIHACQAFMTMALVTWFAASMLVFIYSFHRHYEGDTRLILISLICSYATGLFCFISVMIWALGQEMGAGAGETLNFCFALACIAIPIALAAGLLLTKQLLEDNNKLEADKASKLSQSRFGSTNRLI